MASILLLYEPKSDSAAFASGWGSWSAGLPLVNLASPRLSKVARSTDALPASTKFRLALQREETFQTLVLGPMNVTTAYEYRIRSYTDATYATPAADTGWIKPFTGSSGGWFAPGSLWSNPNWWLGIGQHDDTERGVFLIHHFASPVSSRWWSFEISDEFNPASYIQIGRLFMPTTWAPSVNYSYDGNGLTFVDNTLSSKTLGGNTDRWRRINPRLFRFSLPYLPEDEGYDEAYRLKRTAGFDGEVFVIPNVNDLEGTRQRRSFLGTIRSMEPLSQHAFGLAGTGFEIEENI